VAQKNLGLAELRFKIISSRRLSVIWGRRLAGFAQAPSNIRLVCHWHIIPLQAQKFTKAKQAAEEVLEKAKDADKSTGSTPASAPSTLGSNN
jgi:hypothetical protein